MNLHRLPTHNLPSIQIHDQNYADSASDHHPPSLSQRSMPREIPIPRPGVSPTSSRCGSFHGSYAPTTVVPPPILPLDAPGLPPLSRPRDLRHQSTFGSIGDDSDGEGPGRRAAPGESQECKLSPMCGNLKDGLGFSGSRDACSGRSEDSYEKNWRESIYMKRVKDRAPKELGEESLRAAMHLAVREYDKTVLGKLSARTSEPSSLPQHRLTPVQEVRAFAATQETGSLPRPLAPWTSSPRHLPASAGVSPRTSASPLVLRGCAPGSEPIHLGPKRETFSLPVFSSSLSEFRKSGNPEASLTSRAADGKMSPCLDNRMRRSVSSSNLGPGYDSPDEDSQMEDAPSSHVSQMNRLTLRDARTPPHQYERVGSKRRASSPPRDHRPKPSVAPDPTKKGLMLDGAGPDMHSQNRRTPPIHHRASPGAHQRYYHPAQPGSPASSLASATSVTTMWSASMGQFSPAASSLSTQTDWSPVASYNPSMETDAAKDGYYRQFPPAASLGRLGRLPEMSSLGRDKDSPATKHNPAPRMTGSFICECCPKKPKKFGSRGDLQLHELEKQYGCQYCSNRFKNKNEAERHQNSLHLRKHSWSCASLAGNYEAAFHQSTHRPNFADVCGYCGKEFPLPAQWGHRVEHLTQEHKFGECNQSKKFYRADHFRQHLKHSHSGTSGKWTNVLENACMRDETPPQPIGRGSAGSICDIGALSAEGSD